MEKKASETSGREASTVQSFPGEEGALTRIHKAFFINVKSTDCNCPFFNWFAAFWIFDFENS